MTIGLHAGSSVSIIVKTYYPQSDTDFLGFTFNGKHSYLDLGVLRTISDRMQHSLSPDMNDITADNPGGEGTYYFGSRHKSRKFSIDFAFDHLTEQQMREWKKFCSNKELSDLIFDEEPYKVYKAKITGSPVLKTIAFDENGQRIYKGEGTLEFTCYWPYAHTPDENTKVSTHFISDGKFFDDGKELMNYSPVLYPTKSQWSSVSGIGVHVPGDNPGDIPAPFVLKIPNVAGKVAYETRTLKVGTLEVVIKAASKSLDAADTSAPYTHYEGVEWDSKTGIVSALISSVRKPIAYTGSSLGAIPVTSTAVSWGVKNGDSALTWTGCSLNYHYWYY
jgi:predicted phage tail component-like protein